MKADPAVGLVRRQAPQEPLHALRRLLPQLRGRRRIVEARHQLRVHRPGPHLERPDLRHEGFGKGLPRDAVHHRPLQRPAGGPVVDVGEVGGDDIAVDLLGGPGGEPRHDAHFPPAPLLPDQVPEGGRGAHVARDRTVAAARKVHDEVGDPVDLGGPARGHRGPEGRRKGRLHGPEDARGTPLHDLPEVGHPPGLHQRADDPPVGAVHSEDEDLRALRTGGESAARAPGTPPEQAANRSRRTPPPAIRLAAPLEVLGTIGSPRESQACHYSGSSAIVSGPRKRIGAGVPPGLQIQWDVARAGSGGFDSHTLPPDHPTRGSVPESSQPLVLQLLRLTFLEAL